MDHPDKTTSLMLPKENGDGNVVVIPANGVGKILIREDTILAGLQGCAGCGRGQFTCVGKKQWSVLCWGKQPEKRYYCLVLLLAATFVLSMIGTIFFCFTNTINNAILSSMVIRNNSLAYSIWKSPNVQPLMKVYLFNYTNWDEVRAGGGNVKIRVEEVGPYVYSQQLERVNVKFEGDRLSFQERNHFHYLANKTVGAHFDQVIVPNLPLLGVVSKAVSMQLNLFGQLGLSSALNFADHPEAFVKLPVHRFLWGYEDSIIDTAKPFLSFQGQLKFDNFGLLVTKNGTVSERFTINTGENDKDKMNIIEEFDGQDHLNFWGSPDCNSIEASDGSIFPPSQLENTNNTLYVFYPNLCRRLPFNFEKKVEISDGIVLHRYRMPLNVFDDPVHNRENQCYCEIDTGTCPPRGVINVTDCTMGAPALVSFPHFYLGDEKLREDILGLHPDPLKHDSYIDLHPTLGIALSGKSSLQINIQVRKTGSFHALNSLPNEIILPVAWIEMSVENIPEGLRTLVYHGTYSTAAAQMILTGICIIAFIGSGVCLMLTFIKRRQRPCATVNVKLPTEELKIQTS